MNTGRNIIIIFSTMVFNQKQNYCSSQSGQKVGINQRGLGFGPRFNYLPLDFCFFSLCIPFATRWPSPYFSAPVFCHFSLVFFVFSLLFLHCNLYLLIEKSFTKIHGLINQMLCSSIWQTLMKNNDKPWWLHRRSLSGKNLHRKRPWNQRR